MVKFIKIGRLAVAYDDTKREKVTDQSSSAPPPPPPPTPPKGSGWATFGKFMGILLGLLFLIMVIGLLTPADNSTARDGQGAQANSNSAQAVCERTDVQDLVGKEARKLILDRARPQLVAIALMTMAEPEAYLRKFREAQVSFSDVQGNLDEHGLFACTASAKIDMSDAESGQDIIQSPTLAWRVTFADKKADLTNSNFTVEVDEGSVFSDMLINGKPASEYAQQRQSTGPQAPPAAETADNSSEQQAAQDAANDAQDAAADARRAAEEAARAVEEAE